MQPRINLVTLGVRDLDRATRFYRDGLGLPKVGDDPGVSFFQMGGMVLALWGYNDLADDARQQPNGSGFSGVSLAQCLASKEEVNAVLETARAAGGAILKPAEDTFWGGYSGYFADLDGYAWEIAWNPGWTLMPDGTVHLPG